MAKNKVKIGDQIVGGDKLTLIAGPCAIESSEITFKTAETIARIRDKFKIPTIFKSSYKKANRLSGESFSTIGVDDALSILLDVKKKFGFPILTDVHSIEEVLPASKVADCLQIPAFLCRQTELVQAAAKTMLPVNVKKGQFLAPEDMKPIIEKVHAVGNKQALITERGSSFGYRDLVVDFRGLVIMAEIGCPIVFDCTHSVQKPGGGFKSSSGDPRFILPLARAAVAVGVDAIFIETHPNPKEAFSDKDCQLPTADLESFIISIRQIRSN